MNSIHRALAAALVAAALALPAAASAQGTAGDTIPRYEVPGVTVTATRTPVDRRVVPQRIDVVTGSEAARAGADNVFEALRMSTAVDAIAFPGLLAGVSVRGFRPDYSGLTPRTLLLIDGRPAGTNNLALLDIAGVDRIEVLRGPASALYGSSAMGGVVNVITRRSTGDVLGAVSGSYGGFGRYDSRVTAGGTLGGAFDFDLAAAALGQHAGYRTGSHRTFAGATLEKTLADGSSTTIPWVAPDSAIGFSEFHSRAGSLRIGRPLGGGWRVDARGDAFISDGVENPGDLTPQDFDTRSLKDISRRSGEVQLSGSVGRLSPRLRVYSTRESIDYYNAPFAPHFVNFRTPVTTWGAQAQTGIESERGTMTLGADYAAITGESQAFTADGVRGAPYAPDSSIRSAAAFAQGVWTGLGSWLSLSAGVRLDRIEFEIHDTPHLEGYPPNRETHSVVSPNVGARVTVAPGVQLYGTAGRAFVTPEAFAVAGYSERRAGVDRAAVFVARGNPELDPERSFTWDAGITLFREARGFEAEVGYFHTNVRDRIATSFGAPAGVELTAGGDTILSVTRYVNADEATIRGVEGRLAYDFGRALRTAHSIRLFANGTRILEAEETVGGTATRQLRNVADLTLVGGLEWTSPGLASGRLAGRYVGERVDDDYVAWWEPGEIRYPAYLVLDAGARFRLAGRLTIGVDLLNVTDEEYFEVRGYDRPGRSLGVRAEVGI